MSPRILNVLLVMNICGINSVALAETPSFQASLSDSVRPQTRGSEPYCGIYCLYGAMRWCGSSVQIEELVKPRYLSDCTGSSLADLDTAIADFGFHSLPATNVGISVLQEADCPAILHVRSSPEKSFDHFVLFLGIVDGKAQVLDPGRPLELVPFGRLATRWDGTALFISSTPIVESSLFGPSRVRVLCIIAIATGLVLVLRVFPIAASQASAHWLGRTALEASVGTVVAGFLAIGYHTLSKDGFLAGGGSISESLADIQRDHLARFLPRVDTLEVRRLMNNGHTVFVDARFPFDFDQGHISGAINLPVSALASERRHIMERIPKDKQIIVYCMSETCVFAEQTARMLIENGFTKIAIYEGGWAEWKTQIEQQPQ
mgnify:CR=1 FL=1